MVKQHSKRTRMPGSTGGPNGLRRLVPLVGAALVAGVAIALAVQFLKPQSADAPKRRPAGTLTFNQDIAPIVYNRCAGCHHPDGPAPFQLTSYADVKKRAEQIADVTKRRIMPPWLPEPGCGEFVGDRSLTADQIAMIQQWVEEGSKEGDAGQMPPKPTWREGWELGKPDLVITLAEPFTLDAEGKDVYRNFVIPIPTRERRYVRAVEFSPGNPRAVHHAFLFIDRTRDSQRLDAKDPKPGFPGLHVPTTAQAPSGHFLSWQPGKLHITNSADIAWTLETNSDLVIQAHLRPTGKAEQIQPSIGFYFADHAGPLQPLKIGLWSYDIDIPAGEPGYVLRDTYTLPTDVELIRILPHAHFLGRKMEANARLPDGRSICLLRINRWDFNWQGDYIYRQPVALPKGTVISMAFTYDNSAGNPRNPNQPPQRVRYGVQSIDEMGELWLQLMPRTPEGAAALEKSLQPKILQAGLSYNRYVLGLDPNNAKAHSEIGKSLLFIGGRTNEALRYLQRAVQLQADYDEPHYYLGLLYRLQQRLDDAKTEFQTAIRLNPGNNKFHGNLGLVLMDLGEMNDAEKAFQAALRLDPNDSIARALLEEIARLKGAPAQP